MKRYLLTLASLTALTACAAEKPTTPPAKHEPQAEVHVPSASEIFQSEDARYQAMLTQLQQRNPVQEAQAAIQNGERYFYCNAGRSNTVPGLTPQVYAGLRSRCEVRCLDGVTDALYGKQHQRYLEAALEFSARWNQTMLPACR